MNIKIQMMLDTNPYIKSYLRKHSKYYKDIIRNPLFIFEIENLMKREYGLTVPQKLNKIKDNISMINSFMDILK